MLYSVDCDGQLSGMDLGVIPMLSQLNISKPFLLAGGAGTPRHFADALKSDFIQGVVAGSIFALTKGNSCHNTILLYAGRNPYEARLISYEYLRYSRAWW